MTPIIGHEPKLNALRVGQHAVIKGVLAKDINLKSRLLAMGMVAGTKIQVLRTAPLGDPMEIQALGYRLSLRLSEAAQVVVSNVT